MVPGCPTLTEGRFRFDQDTNNKGGGTSFGGLLGNVISFDFKMELFLYLLSIPGHVSLLVNHD